MPDRSLCKPVSCLKNYALSGWLTVISIKVRISGFQTKRAVVEMCRYINGNTHDLVIPFDHVLRLEKDLRQGKRKAEE